MKPHGGAQEAIRPWLEVFLASEEHARFDVPEERCPERMNVSRMDEIRTYVQVTADRQEEGPVEAKDDRCGDHDRLIPAADTQERA